jgi:hypothetical protein
MCPPISNSRWAQVMLPSTLQLHHPLQLHRPLQPHRPACHKRICHYSRLVLRSTNCLMMPLLCVQICNNVMTPNANTPLQVAPNTILAANPTMLFSSSSVFFPIYTDYRWETTPPSYLQAPRHLYHQPKFLRHKTHLMAPWRARQSLDQP